MFQTSFLDFTADSKRPLISLVAMELPERLSSAIRTPEVISADANIQPTCIADAAPSESASRSPVSITILDLPPEVLDGIFDCLRTPIYGITPGPPKALTPAEYTKLWEDNHEAIKNARLACRAFHRSASPLLFQFLRVTLDQESLYVADSISRNPLLAGGVHVIEVVLAYRPKDFAEDITKFSKHQRHHLRDVTYDFARDFRARRRWGRPKSVTEKKENHREGKRVQKMLNSINSLESAWDEVCRLARPDYSDSNEYNAVKPVEHKSFKYHRLLLESHERYVHEHEEQARLLTDGLFSKSLASSMSRMANCTSLRITDQPVKPGIAHLDDYASFGNHNKLFRCLVAPVEWGCYIRMGNIEIMPTKLLSELPVAIHRAGVKLRHIQISVMPDVHTHSLIGPGSHQGLDWTWDDLVAACQYLDSFSIGQKKDGAITYYGDNIKNPSKTLATIDSYMGAMFSGNHLEDVHLNTAIGKSGEDGRPPYLFRHAFHSTAWPSIKRVNISHVTLTQRGLNKLCEALGDVLERLRLNDIGLDGSWEKPLDILRGKAASSHSRPCTVELRSLKGGEFRQDIPWAERKQYLEPLHTAAREYIQGVIETNPTTWPRYTIS